MFLKQFLKGLLCRNVKRGEGNAACDIAEAVAGLRYAAAMLKPFFACVCVLCRAELDRFAGIKGDLVAVTVCVDVVARRVGVTPCVGKAFLGDCAGLGV